MSSTPIMFEIDIFTEIIAGLIVAAIIGLISFMSILHRCITKQNTRSIRQSKSIMRLTRFIAYEKKRLHPDTQFADIEKEIKDALTDEKDEF